MKFGDGWILRDTNDDISDKALSVFSGFENMCFGFWKWRKSNLKYEVDIELHRDRIITLQENKM